MIHDNLMRLAEILQSSESIKSHAQEVYNIRMALDESLTDEEKIKISNSIKSKVQGEAEQALTEANDWGAIYMATGSGKSRIAVDKVSVLFDDEIRPDPNILLVVPTEKLRDENWKEEFEKWDNVTDYHKMQRCCYASLNKYENEHFSLVILDEGHNATDNNVVKFFKQNTVSRCIVLTATRPTDLTKVQIFKDLNFKPVYELSLDESVMLGLVAPYDIVIITMYLDNVDKYIVAGRKDKPFNVTEKTQYNYLSHLALTRPSKMGFLTRMRFIYDLRSKTQTAKLILEHVIPKDLRTLIFCGSKRQAIELCDRRFFSKPSPPKKLEQPTAAKVKKFGEDYIKYEEMIKHYEGDEAFTDFKDGKIDRLACVNSLNEGHNLNNLDVGFVVQLNRNELHLIQRTGRFIRYRSRHRGLIIILSVDDSIEKEWVKEATKNFNSENIRVIELSRLRMGMETISF